MSIFYSTIFHDARRKMGLTVNEYCLVDYIFKWQGNPMAPRPGWCSKTRFEMAEFLDITERGIRKMLARLDEMSIVEINTGTRDVRATRAWFDAVIAENQRLERPMKFGPPPPETVPPQSGAEQSSGHKNYVDAEQSSGRKRNKVPGKAEQSSGRKRKKVPNINKEDIKSVNNKDKKGIAGKNPPALIHSMVEVFEKKHKQHFSDGGQWVGFAWSGKEFAALVDLNKKLAKRYEQTMSAIPTDEQFLSTWDLFLDKVVESDIWFLNVFTPAGLNSQFQNAINKIHSHHAKRNTSSNAGNPGINHDEFFSGYGTKNP